MSVPRCWEYRKYNFGCRPHTQKVASVLAILLVAWPLIVLTLWNNQRSIIHHLYCKWRVKTSLRVMTNSLFTYQHQQCDKKLYILTLVLVVFATFGFICSETKICCAAEWETATELDLSIPIEGKHNPSYQMSLVLTLTTRSLLLDWKVLNSAPLKGQPGGHGHNLLNWGASRCELNHAQSTGKATRGYLAGFCCPLEKNPKGRIIRFNLTSKRAPLRPCPPPPWH